MQLVLYFLDRIRAKLRLLMAGASARAMVPTLATAAARLHAVGANSSMVRVAAVVPQRAASRGLRAAGV